MAETRVHKHIREGLPNMKSQTTVEHTKTDIHQPKIGAQVNTQSHQYRIS